MKIRTKLLLVMTGLLVVSAGLSFYLHMREGRRIGDEFEGVLEHIVQSVVRAHEPGGLLAPQPSVPTFEIEERLVPRISLGPKYWHVRLERHFRLRLDEDPASFAPADVLPPEALEVALLDELRNPIDLAREESVPRELLIAGAVLMAGLGMVGFLGTRLSRPINELTRKMEQVASGDLQANVEVDAATAAGSSDEVSKMSVAFNTMVDRLRENRELEKKIFQAERLSSMGNLAAGVAHDIRNPLNTIGLTLAHVREQFRSESEGETARFESYLDDVKGELDRLGMIVSDFLSLAHPDRGEKTETDLSELVTDCLRLFRKEAESKGVEIAFEDAGDVPPIVSNGQQLRGAFTNILINALHAVEAGVGEAGVGEAGVGTIKVSLFAREGDTVLRVEDNGCGIEPENLDKIFLPYFTTRNDGTGLGLHVARGAIEAQGGRVEVQSEVGVGTRFDIVLEADQRVLSSSGDLASPPKFTSSEETA